ncbi:MAG: DNA polymerase/3'-5' exonuclease PolX [Bacillota bacterium]|nr:DNA polymerase/3'-5' exonuclease PolX [Bacillota bacterium]
MEKHGVAGLIEEIGVLLELKGENPFKSRAYYNAARIIELMGEEELERLVREGKLKDVKGIGTALNEKITELVTTGTLVYYEELKQSIPEGLLEILKVPGLGPRKIQTLHEMLDITTLAELEYACRENRLINIKGFGSKTQENILEGIEFLRRNQNQYFYSEAMLIADDLLEQMKTIPGIGEVSLAGSIRRFREIVKDIDLVASAEKPGNLTHQFTKLPGISGVIALGDTKASVQMEEGINVDLRVVKKSEYPYALHHFTGSKEHNTALRHRAKSMGLKINEYGLFRGEELVKCSTEKDFFAALGLDYIPPELRENNGEIEAAENSTLPLLVESKDIKGIFHVHSVYSDGTNTLEEIVRYCLDSGLEYVGITDHSQSAFYAGGLKDDDLKRQAEEIQALREKYSNLGIYAGVEADIRADGTLDYPDEILEKLDFVIASVHSGLKMERSKMTERVIQALRNPYVTMLGHPTNRLLLGRDSSPIDLETIFEVALEKGIIIELNASPARLDLDWRHLKKVKEMGLLVSINPDAHRLENFIDIELGVSLARKGWLDKGDIFNSLSRSEVEKYLLYRRGKSKK